MFRGVKNYDRGVNDALNEVSRELQNKKPIIGLLFMFVLTIGFLIGMAFMAFLIFSQP